MTGIPEGKMNRERDSDRLERQVGAQAVVTIPLVQAVLQDLPRARRAAAAAVRHTQLVFQTAHGVRAVVDGAADVLVGYGVADTDIHRRSRLTQSVERE